jgi:preprotein translocase subunit SecG
MSKQTTIVVVIVVALVLVILMIIKNQRDRKKLFTPEGSDPVQEQNMEHHNHRDKL